MKVPADAHGKKFKCVRCGAMLRLDVPLEEAAAPPSGGEAAAAPAPVRMEPIGQMLIRNGLVTREQLEQALAQQRKKGGKTFENLIELGFLDKAVLHEFLSRQPGVATINLANYRLEAELVNLIPRDLALRELVLPIDRLGKLLTVAMACPLDLDTIRELEKVTGLRVKGMLCKLDDIHAAVEKMYRGRRARGGNVLRLEDLPGMGSAPAGKAETSQQPDAPARQAEAPRKEMLAHLRELLVSGEPRQFVEEAGKESAVARAILDAVNSGPYSAEEVTSIGVAVALMGREGVAKILDSVAKA
jgi:hypothetical protein